MKSYFNLFKSLFLMSIFLCLTAQTASALNILLVNDDGYEAEGINILFSTLEEAGHEVTMVAPKDDQTAKGTSVVIQSGPLMEYGGTIELVNVATGKWYLNGSPVDCVSAAINIVMAANPPDLVLSGPNCGENVGYMATYSATVGAAIRAIQQGIPAIAFSVGMDWTAYLENKSTELTTQAYPKACQFITDMIGQLAPDGLSDTTLLPKGTGLNINYPVMLPSDTENPLGTKYTVIDKYVTFSMVYGFNEESAEAVLPGMWPSLANNFKEGEAIPKNSEGKLFEDGYITISVIDGDINSSKKNKVFKYLKHKKLQ